MIRGGDFFCSWWAQHYYVRTPQEEYVHIYILWWSAEYSTVVCMELHRALPLAHQDLILHSTTQH
jgi:hypothetical protein